MRTDEDRGPERDERPGDDARIEQVAAAILDGTPVNWDALDSQATPDDRRVLRQMKSIAAIAAAQTPDTPETWGALRLLEKIGQGAFGDVYRAWDPRLDRQVALKLMPAEHGSSSQVETSIIEEGRLLARLRHPNVVTIYGAERIDDRVGLWMEYVDGRTLHQRVVEDQKRFSVGEVTRLGQTVAGAVAAVHAAGLLHRDIKAQNVMIDAEGRVALMDFGAGGEASASSQASMAGTPLYLAPEVLTGASGPTVQADVYGIGVLLFFLLTGSYPVVGRDLDDLRQSHARRERRSLKKLRPDVPRPLRRVVERALDPDPARRYPTAAALATALGRVRLARWTAPAGLAAAAALLLTAFVMSRPAVPVSADAEEPQIAVLPLLNLTAGAVDDGLADGLTDEIIRNLGTVRGLDVRSRTSSFAFKGSRRSIAEVGQQLRVGYVLEGSIARAGSRLRVNAQLTKVDGEVRLWADRFERNLTVPDMLAIQDDISRAIVDKLRLAFGGGRQRRYDIDVPTYELFLRARTLAERQGDTDPLQATKLFEKIIASDPTYAPAYAGLVLAYAYLSMGPYQGVAYEKAQPVMRAAAMKAVGLGPMLADSHAAMGWVHARDFRWADARREFERAIELNPNLISSYTSFSFGTLQPLGRFAEAEQLLGRAAERDPFNNDVPRALARVLIDEQRYREAVSVLQAVSRVDSDLPRLDSLLGRALALDGRLEDSLPLLERRRERALDPRSGLHPWVAFPWVKLGRREEAERLARENDHLPYRRAIINAALGNREKVFSGLEEMAETEPQRVVILMRSPELAAYRDDERFLRLLHRFNLEPFGR